MLRLVIRQEEERHGERRWEGEAGAVVVQSQGNLEQAANGSMKMSRAGFRLTAVRPRAGSSRSLAADPPSPACTTSPGGTPSPPARPPPARLRSCLKPVHGVLLCWG